MTVDPLREALEQRPFTADAIAMCVVLFFALLNFVLAFEILTRGFGVDSVPATGAAVVWALAKPDERP